MRNLGFCLGGRLRQHLVAERAAETTHALVQRSRSAMHPRKLSTFVTRAPAHLWSATPLPIREPSTPMSSVTASATAATSTPRMASAWISCNSCRSRIHSRYRVSRSSIIPIGPGNCRSRTIWIGCLGNQREQTAPYIVTEIDANTGALLARNPWSNGFQSRIAFMDMAGRQQTLHGRSRRVHRPSRFARRAGGAARTAGPVEPCRRRLGSLRRDANPHHLAAGRGNRASVPARPGGIAAAAVALIERYRSADLDAELKAVTDFWDETLGAVQVKTPDRSMDILLNGWLLYQTLACRVWARTRVLPVERRLRLSRSTAGRHGAVVSRPQIAREHILRAAARQFEAGDVQHWWLPSSGQGIKTRVSDDRIWLAFVTAHYLEVTEDFAVLDEPVPYLAGGPLARGSARKYFPHPSPRPSRRYSSTASARSIRASRSARMACRCSAPAIGTTA